MSKTAAMSSMVVASLYRFAPIADIEWRRDDLLAQAKSHHIKGTLLLAPEGINGTISGSRAAIDSMMATIRAIPGFADLEHKESVSPGHPFGRLKVKVKDEIVTMGRPDVDPKAKVGHYLDPHEWNELLRDPDVVVIDTRNDYEVAVGSFDDAIDPGLARFRDFPAWWEAHAEDFDGKKIAMFCTGGIRCEKATSWVRSQGLDQVYHLKGGILTYLEEVPQSQSRWHGECFVFDERVTVTHGLDVGTAIMCAACGRPVTPHDRHHPRFEEGVSCGACFDEHSAARRSEFRARHRQRHADAEPPVSSVRSA